MQAVRDGFSAYCDFWFPYPPLSLPLIYIPALFAEPYESYRRALHMEMMVFDIGTFAFLSLFLANRLDVKAWRRAAVLCVYSLFGFSAAHLIYDRLDLVMSFFFLGALYFYTGPDRRRWLAYAFLLAGALVKLLPIFFLPLFAIIEWFRKADGRWPSPNRAWLPALLVALPFGAVLLYYQVFVCDEIFAQLFQHGHRGIQIESNWAVPLIIDKVLNGTPTDVDYSYGAFHFLDPFVPKWYLGLSKYVGFALLGLVFFAFARWFRRNLVDSGRLKPITVAYLLYSVILVLISTQRVLSPQYMIWMWPFAAMQLAIALRPGAALAGSTAIFGLTYVVFDMGFFKILRFDPGYSLALIVRNALLAIWTADALRRAARDLRLHRKAAIEEATL